MLPEIMGTRSYYFSCVFDDVYRSSHVLQRRRFPYSKYYAFEEQKKNAPRDLALGRDLFTYDLNTSD
jgi:hypothetical protein